MTYNQFGKFATHAYNGICFSFFSPDFYSPSGLSEYSPYIIYNFDKINEPTICVSDSSEMTSSKSFEYEGQTYTIVYPDWLSKISAKTDRFTDALIYISSMLPVKKRKEQLGKYKLIRTDHRFHPHFRRKIYRQPNSYVADLPYGYLNLYANAELTLSDRIHACAVTLAYGNSAMLFAKTDRIGLLGRVGAEGITDRPVKLDMVHLAEEKKRMVDWLNTVFSM
jgi:hypothetical protein